MSDSFRKRVDVLFHIDKDPADIADYSIDWSARLESGETISASVWTLPTGISQSGSSEVAGVTTVWLSGGSDGNQYLIGNQVDTSGGRRFNRYFVIDVKRPFS
jgi:hypothetical protein